MATRALRRLIGRPLASLASGSQQQQQQRAAMPLLAEAGGGADRCDCGNGAAGAQRRHFRAHLPWEYYLVRSWNAYDERLVEKLGPEKAAAEWLANNSAKVRYVDDVNFTKDVGRLCAAGGEIEAIDATNSSISSHGFRYLKNLRGLKEVLLVSCKHIDDAALSKLDYAKDTLKVLAIDACPEVTALGLMSLAKLRRLRHLHLSRLSFIRGAQMRFVKKQLRKALPRCKVEYNARTGMLDQAVFRTGNYQAIVPCHNEKRKMY